MILSRSNAVIEKRDKSFLYAGLVIAILICCFILYINSYYSQVHIQALGFFNNLAELLDADLGVLYHFFSQSKFHCILFSFDVIIICLMAFNYTTRKKTNESLINRLSNFYYLIKNSFYFIKTNFLYTLCFILLLILIAVLLNKFLLSEFDLKIEYFILNLVRILTIFPVLSVISSYLLNYFISGKIIRFSKAIKNITFARFFLIAFTSYILISLGVYSLILSNIFFVFSKSIFLVSEVFHGLIKLHYISNGLFQKIFALRIHHTNIRFTDSYSNKNSLLGKVKFLDNSANFYKKPYLSHYFAFVKPSLHNFSIRETIQQLNYAMIKFYPSNPLHLKDGLVSQLGYVNMMNNSTGVHALVYQNKVGIGKHYVFVSTNKDLVTLIENSCLLKKTISYSEKLNLSTKPHNDLGSLEYFLNKPVCNHTKANLPLIANNGLASLVNYPIKTVQDKLGNYDMLTNYKSNNLLGKPSKDLSGKPDKNLSDSIWNRDYLNQTAECLKHQTLTVFFENEPLLTGVEYIKEVITAGSISIYYNQIDINTQTRYEKFSLNLFANMIDVRKKINDIYTYQVYNNIVSYRNLQNQLLFRQDLLNNDIKTGLNTLLGKLESSMVNFILHFINLELPAREMSYYYPAITWIYINIGQTYPIYTCTGIWQKANQLASEFREIDLFLQAEDSYLRGINLLFRLDAERLGFPINILQVDYNAPTPDRSNTLVTPDTANSNTIDETLNVVLSDSSLNNSMPNLLEISGNDISSEIDKIKLYSDILDVFANNTPNCKINTIIPENYKGLLYNLLNINDYYSKQLGTPITHNFGIMQNSFDIKETIYKEIFNLINQYKLEKNFLNLFTKEKDILEKSLPLLANNSGHTLSMLVKDNTSKFYISRLISTHQRYNRTNAYIITKVVFKRIEELTTIINKNK